MADQFQTMPNSLPSWSDICQTRIEKIIIPTVLIFLKIVPLMLTYMTYTCTARINTMSYGQV